MGGVNQGNYIAAHHDLTGKTILEANERAADQRGFDLLLILSRCFVLRDYIIHISQAASVFCPMEPPNTSRRVNANPLIKERSANTKVRMSGRVYVRIRKYYDCNVSVIDRMTTRVL